MKNKTQSTRAFTLIELLMVIAIIGILAGILIPAIGMVKEKAQIATSKAQLSQYLTAIQSFKGEYSYYPFSSVLNSDGELELDTDANSKLFFETLSARDISTPTTSVSGDGNRRRIQFYTFNENELADGSNANLSPSIAADTIIDSFGNNQIRIVFDTDNDGRITVPDPDGGTAATKEIRSLPTAYVLEHGDLGSPAYYLYE